MNSSVRKAAVLLLSAGGVMIWLVKRPKATSDEQQLTPRELASRELDKLWHDAPYDHRRFSVGIKEKLYDKLRDFAGL